VSVKIYHNPRCSKSRQALELLRAQGVEPEIVEYLKTPPDHQTLDRLLTTLGMQPRDLMRKKEKEYQAAGLADPGLTRYRLIDAMIEHPKLIERPIVVKGKKVALGRPPERILDIL